MDLVFPFKNIAFNSFIAFVEKERVKDFFRHIDSGADTGLFRTYVEIYKESIPDYENEILQIIETSSQETINKYFKVLLNNALYAHDLIETENVKRLFIKWNEEDLKEFEKKASEKGQKNLQYEKKKPDLIEESRLNEYLDFIKGLYQYFIDVVKKYAVPWNEGKIKSRLSTVHLKPIIFFEGETDLDYIKKAATLLGEVELLTKVELRQRGSSSNLNKLWTLLTENNWETVPQKKMLIYDCDANRESTDFGHIYRRTIPKQENLIARGIENLFPNALIKKAIETKKEFVDFKETNGTERGKSYRLVENTINKDEKRNFCNWACENGTVEKLGNDRSYDDSSLGHGGRLTRRL